MPRGVEGKKYLERIMSRASELFRKAVKSKKVIASSIGIMLVAVMTVTAYALNPYISREQEAGTITGNAIALADTSASGGQTVKFGTSPTSYPSVPPAVVCGNNAILDGPSSAPTGAVVVPAGDNNAMTLSWNTPSFAQAGKTFWFAPGVHTLGSTQYDQIGPGANTTFIGAPGAIIDGQSINETAFGGTNTGVTIKNLTIQNFNTPHDQGTVNHDSASNWTVSYNTFTKTAAAAVFASTNNVVTYNCMTKNGQYGFQTFNGSTSPTHILLDHNEISFNNTGDTENTAGIPNCGCSGGGKFWDSRDVTVTNNYVHGNYGGGLWADTTNVGFLFQGNWIEGNEAEGIMYEVSYNFQIKDNVFLKNGLLKGPTNPGFPTGAIYISESGSDSRVTTTNNNFNTQSVISGNLFQDNWDGVVMWENSNRFCSNGLPTTQCTLVNPSTITSSSCATNLADSTKNKPNNVPSYYNDCRWRTQNISVTNNKFQLTAANAGAQCTVSNACGLNALFSNYGSVSPYNDSSIPTNIAFNQNNVFSNNTYNGPWYFMGWAQSNTHYPLTFTEWRNAVTDKCATPTEISSGTCNSGFGQDAGSTYTP